MDMYDQPGLGELTMASHKYCVSILPIKYYGRNQTFHVKLGLCMRSDKVELKLKVIFFATGFVSHLVK